MLFSLLPRRIHHFFHIRVFLTTKVKCAVIIVEQDFHRLISRWIKTQNTSEIYFESVPTLDRLFSLIENWTIFNKHLVNFFFEFDLFWILKLIEIYINTLHSEHRALYLLFSLVLSTVFHCFFFPPLLSFFKCNWTPSFQFFTHTHNQWINVINVFVMVCKYFRIFICVI